MTPTNSVAVILTIARKAWSPSVIVAALYAFTGIGFSGASLIFAKVLTTTDFGTITLLISIFGVAVPLAPLGLDGVVNRQLMSPSRQLLVRTLMLSAATGAVIAPGAFLLYRLPADLLVLLFATAFVGGSIFVCAALHQRYKHFVISVLLGQSSNLFLITASMIMLFAGMRSVEFPIAFVCGGYLLAALPAWTRLLMTKGAISEPASPFPWRDALSYAMVNAAGLVLLQLERLVIPKVMSMEDLALFGVAAALVLAPFRTLQMGVAFTLLPRFSGTTSVEERRHILLKELITVGSITVLGSIVMLPLAPYVADLIYHGRYELQLPLLVAALFGGYVRVLGGFSRGIATGLCNTRQLATLNILMWFAVAVATLGAIIGSKWGLTGVLYGSSVGWIVRSVASVVAALPSLRH